MWILIFLLQASISTLVAENGTDEVKGFFDFLKKKSTTTSTTPAPTFRTCDCDCGVRNEGVRIVGGEQTSANEYPWLVRLSYNNQFFCGGILVNDRHVVTASHCVSRLLWFFIQVTFGEYDRCASPSKPETRYVLRGTVGSPWWNILNGDIALLRLNDRVPITDAIRPICLPRNPGELYESKMGIVVGWGKLSETLPTTCVPHAVELPIMSNLDCQARYGEIIQDHMVCAGLTQGGKDSCQGDSGGPLFIKRSDNKYELVGVVSWGRGCAREGKPGVYTRVTHYIDWIRSKAQQDACFCREPETADSFEESTTLAAVTSSSTPDNQSDESNNTSSSSSTTPTSTEVASDIVTLP